MEDVILEMINITKVFPGVKALNNVNLQVQKGEIHALVGENGAGKSTLMKVLSGVYPYETYTGDIRYKGKRCEFKNIKESEKLGIVIIHQELALIPYLSIEENIFLGNEQGKHGLIDWHATTMHTQKLLATVGLKELPSTLVTNIGVGKQQLVEIAKALSKEVELLILDEPTAALNEDDSDNLLELLLEFKRQGISSIIISHKLNEISRIADSITVLRDGATIETLNVRNDHITEERIIKGMVGRELTELYPKRDSAIGEIIFEVQNWTAYHHLHSSRKVIDHVNFHVKQGEVVGIAGLMGAGRTELAMSIFGRSYGQKISGQIYKNGVEVHLKNVSQAIEQGIAYVTEDRKQYGLILNNDIKRNITLANLKNIANHSVINENKEILVAEKSRQQMNIKCSSVLQNTVNLSGGNQQKVVLSKWIFTEPDVLILDEPTRGIDVGAKFEIYSIINKLAKDGKGIVLISSELPELLGMCDRIYVMSEGSITGELAGAEASQERIMQYVMSK
ncbi:multiple monosaccharide ABC transporter ATP-binding protein [Pelosinus propionicus]|uniref:Multiple monosaccharide ABC transporter ATP-binding protein n=1 Tax=Pelosinus propionicus DSM 13327 TaxID=1123291 RepID=A0A1I4ISH4_9FIRM|nr:multiple monosaccharide ABC transporter ATP-binding protein [Pelosinus propionicus]SFL56953.1 multiple monosaccharide ABC transporter ATP-binding protein [Pelosinus propionicus DSM 13327]